MQKVVKGVLKKSAAKALGIKVTPNKTQLPVSVKFGKPITQVSFSMIKLLSGLGIILIICNICFALRLFYSSIAIRNHLGYFLNIISKGDGNILPSLQALPVFIFFCIDIAFMVILSKIFERKRQAKFNWIMFLLILVSLVLILLVLVLLIFILSYSYSEHKELHNGIVDAMQNYSTDSWYKEQIDRLQIEFQCCGSKKYDEWYSITWYDANLASKGRGEDSSQGNTPFSCCSVSSNFPCIHHKIEETGRVYLYTPEQNLSISMDGCYLKLRKKKKKVGWTIVGNLFLLIIMQLAIIISMRFLQTAHCVNYKFHGHSKPYVIWLIGYYSGKTEIPTASPEETNS